jgi:NAD(P)-dependent dehydrogenase (short-subunit alcohol dehydrogenase family)
MTDTTSLTGRIVFITGANTGIGRVTAIELAKRGARVFVAVRSVDKVQDLIAEAKAFGGTIEALAIDLGDFASVRACASEFQSRNLPIDVLINNAGVAGIRGLTKSGFELAFGVNHMGHFLLTTLLLDRVVAAAKASGGARIITVASRAHRNCKRLDLSIVQQRTRTVAALPEYAASKLANILFSAELARRLAGTGVTTYSLHPGVVASEIWRGVPWPFRSLMKLAMITPEQGALTTLHCATSKDAGQETGLYYDKSNVYEPTPLARDAELARTLWQQSEAWIAASAAT